MKSTKESVLVRLLLFSGRPDPQWSLSEAQIEGLAARLARTIGVEGVEQAATGGLGYRGFLVQNVAGLAGLPAEFIVFRSILSVPARPGRHHWRDLAKVEDWLLELARQRGFGQALEAFGVGRGKPESESGILA